MKILKDNDEFGLYITLIEEDKKVIFNYGGNGDLYWSINKKTNISNSETFLITKENYGLYNLFDELFFDIGNINIFDKEDSEEQIEEYKKRFRLCNYSNYSELFNKENKTITWYSDDAPHDFANILKIVKENDIFRLEFYIQQSEDEFDKNLYSLKNIPIRFSNSGSKYKPFNMLFMKMYNNMNKIDDINDFGHQIHIEEYLYKKAKTKKLMK